MLCLKILYFIKMHNTKGICFATLTDPLNLLIAKLFKCFALSPDLSPYHAVGMFNGNELHLVHIYQFTPIAWINNTDVLMSFASQIAYCETNEILTFNPL